MDTTTVEDVDPDTEELTAKIKFKDVVDKLEKVYNASKPAQKYKILENFINSLKTFLKKFVGENPEKKCNTNLYPLVRLFLPDQDHTSFGIQNATMGRLYIRILNLHKTSDDAQKLMGTMSVSTGTSSGRMDYAEVVYSVIKNRFTTTAEISVYDLNRHLDEMSTAYQNNNRRNIENDLQELITKMSALEQKWLVRIILKRLRLGVGEKKIFSFLHPAAPDLFVKYSDLMKVCELITKDEIEDVEEKIEVFSHIRPMLCGRIEVKAIETKCTTHNFFLETKMDGERFQLHMKDRVYQYFSRNGYDYTKTYGADSISGSLTPALSKLLAADMRSVIFDGEMMVWNKEHQFYHTKGENIDVKTLQISDPTLRPCYVVFDVLYYNGASMIEKPLAERMRLVRSLITEQVGVLMRCQQRNVRDHMDIMDGLNTAIDNKEEGIVIKEIESMYRPNLRNGGWYKLKADYIDGLIDNFDLTIIGAYMNKSRKYIDKFLVGVMDPTRNLEEPTFLSVAAVSGGLNRREWLEITNDLKPHWNEIQLDKTQKTKVAKNPPGLEFGVAVPDVWINPKNSKVLEVKASELTKTSTYRTNYTLRFPRILKIRSDKNWNDCCTLQEFNSLCPSTSGAVQKIAKRFVEDDFRPQAQTKKSKKNTSPIKQPTSELVSEDVNKIDEICDGLEFCIISGSRKQGITVENLEKLVKMHGGHISKNPGPNTKYVIAGDLTLRVQNTIKLQRYDVISCDWLVNALSGESPQSHLLDILPKHVISSTAKLKLELMSQFDEHGDSFVNPITKEDLGSLLTDIILPKSLYLTRVELFEVENEILRKRKNFNIFRLYHGLFLEKDKKLPQLIFAARGGLVSVENPDNERNARVTHIFQDKKILNLELLKNFIRETKLIDQSVLIVDYEWIIECDREGVLVDHSKFEIPFD